MELISIEMHWMKWEMEFIEWTFNGIPNQNLEWPITVNRVHNPTIAKLGN